jgi:hypothetical protein
MFQTIDNQFFKKLQQAVSPAQPKSKAALQKDDPRA